MFAKINFLTALSALVLFFLPWMDIRCSGKSVATQTGFQTITGRSTPSEEMKPKPAAIQINLPVAEERQKESLGHAALIAVALVDVAAAVVFAFLALRTGSPRHTWLTGVLCAMALTLICIQWGNGFPAKQKLTESLSGRASEQTRLDGSAGLDPGFASAAMLDVETKPLPGLYLTLAALAIPTLIWVNGLLDRLKKQEGK
ncbi:hypothetical protein [Luteolibacter sp. LG18]|uniref:hypothetical protein n=1 Tax=Luteolibacter sp. LG18 TaxID=2819286 RepID=UPI002B31436E|nr:hypothetical protein llg_40650 [Luteolibacter sp. LG18]